MRNRATAILSLIHSLCDISMDLFEAASGKWGRIGYVADYLEHVFVPTLRAFEAMEENNEETIQNAESGGLT